MRCACTSRPFSRLGERFRTERGAGPRAGRAVLCRARLREVRARLSAGRPALLSPMGRARQGQATRRTLSALAAGKAPTSRAATIGAPVAQLDVETAVKASQAVSGEIELDKLIENLMTITLEHAGAERGLLIISGRRAVDRGGSHRRPQNLRSPPTGARSALGTSRSPCCNTSSGRRSPWFDDALRENLFSEDEYVLPSTRSVLCLPLVKQAKLVGVLYLENNWPRPFSRPPGSRC